MKCPDCDQGRFKNTRGTLVTCRRCKGSGTLSYSEQTFNSMIVLRVTTDRKAAYVRAAKSKTLAAWIFNTLDQASGYTPTVDDRRRGHDPGRAAR